MCIASRPPLEIISPGYYPLCVVQVVFSEEGQKNRKQKQLECIKNLVICHAQQEMTGNSNRTGHESCPVSKL